MNIKDAEVSIKKYMRDMESRKADSIKLIENNNLGAAMIALKDAVQCEALVTEYQFIIELMEVGE